MIDALVGGVIMVVATTSLLYSLEVAEKAINQAGKNDPSISEQRLLDDFGLGGADDPFWTSNIRESWDQWGKR